MPHVALVTCARLPDLDPDDRALRAPLARHGIAVSAAIWDDPAVDWTAFDLAVLRSPWDYTERPEAFARWSRSVPRLLNSADVVAWNTDKRYLVELSASGVPVVPTTWIDPGSAFELPAAGEHVLKPRVGAGSLGAGRFDLGNHTERAAAAAHAEGLLRAGQTVMLQPFVTAIDERGETGVILIDGRFSHAIIKGAMLSRETRATVDGLYVEERIEAHNPSHAELALAFSALEAAPFRARDLLYARVDMVAGPDGAPMIMELELTEPSLFMATAPGSAERFAAAIATRIERGRARAPARRARPQQEREVS